MVGKPQRQKLEVAGSTANKMVLYPARWRSGWMLVFCSPSLSFSQFRAQQGHAAIHSEQIFPAPLTQLR